MTATPGLIARRLSGVWQPEGSYILQVATPADLPAAPATDGIFCWVLSTDTMKRSKAGAWIDWVGATGATGATGSAGAAGSTVRSGSGVPSAGLGSNGDWYINTATNLIYGPKTAGAWGSGISLIGPTGSTGAAGTNGTNGATGATGAPWPRYATTAARDTAIPSPVDGDHAYVTATHTLYIYGIAGWVAWDNEPQTWTPSLTQSATVAKTVTLATYQRRGRKCILDVVLSITGAGTAGQIIIVGNLPVTATRFVYGCGLGIIYDTAPSSLVWPFQVVVATTTTIQFTDVTQGTNVTNWEGQVGMAAALANGDQIHFTAEYPI